MLSIFPTKPSRLDLTDPFQGRRWLNLLHDDPVTGIRLAPNLNLTSSCLGFSISSNALGLRGPADVDASNVIAGTSFSMGFGVDNDRNWYDDLIPDRGWFNVGFPVGLTEWERTLNQLHNGPRKFLLLQYHPNFWTTTRAFDIARESGIGAFAHFGWKTDWLSCAKLAYRRRWINNRKLDSGQLIDCRHEGLTYRLSSEYCYTRPDDIESMYGNLFLRLAEWVNSFEQSVVIRLRIREECVPEQLMTPKLKELRDSCEDVWQRAKAELSGIASKIVEPEGCELSHFHTHDNHLNISGNNWLRQVVENVLAESPTMASTEARTPQRSSS